MVKMSSELGRINLVSWIDLMSKVDLMMGKIDLMMHGVDMVSCYLVEMIELMHRIMVKRISLMSWMLVNPHVMGSIMNRTTGLLDSIRRVSVG